MGFLERIFNKRAKKNSDTSMPVLAAAIANTVSSEIYQDLLKENNIPFVCRQQGAGGYLKILTGGLLVTDSIYVNPRDYDRARELYENYIDIEEEIEIIDSEDS